MKQGTPEEAEKSQAESTELVSQDGGIVHEDALMDAAEMALDGADIKSMAERKGRARRGLCAQWRVGRASEEVTQRSDRRGVNQQIR